ncbi:MAG: heavy metal sensor histidine kinase [Pseudomonas aeruginosa]|nr:heavy metal sensor histidine kinase [Pseudomonas aeruginosa]
MPRTAVPSVRRRLLINLLVGFVLCWLSVAALTYHLSLKQVNRLFDDDMVDFGEAALRLLDLATEDQASEDGSITEIIERSREAIQGLPLLRRESALGYALWRDGQPLLSSLNLPPEITAQGPGFSTVEAQGTHWRVLQLNIDGFQIWISENLIYRQHTMNLLLFYSLFPLLLALPLLGGLVWFGVARGLAPLREVQAEVQQRSARHLQPIAVEAVPLEIRGLIDELNLLLERLRTALEAERRLTSDAAHEIRTPIGSLMGHGQVALRQPRSNEEYQALIASNQEELERIARMVESILFLARADDVRAAVERSRLDLGEELRRQAEYFEGLAEERGLSLDIQISGQLRADPQLFRRALSNLLANAIRYASAESLIEVRGLRRSGEFLLSVENACDRLPAEPLSRLFDRFYRGDAARSDAQSSGLGLAIVQAIMRLHGGRAEASAPAPGRIRFELAFPAQD